MKLLQYMASVAAMAHAPFVAAASPKFFGITDFNTLPNLKDLKSIFEGPQYTKWQSFRESEDCPLRRPDPSPVPPPPALRPEHPAGQELQLPGGCFRQP